MRRAKIKRILGIFLLIKSVIIMLLVRTNKNQSHQTTLCGTVFLVLKEDKIGKMASDKISIIRKIQIQIKVKIML